MNYLIAQLQEDMCELQDEEWDIRIDRGQRYGGKDDTLENIATFGADGAIVHANECFNRIKNMFGQVKDLADLKDAVMDGRNYLAYIYILETRDKPVTVCACDVNPPKIPVGGFVSNDPPKVVPWTGGEFSDKINASLPSTILDMPEVESPEPSLRNYDVKPLFEDEVDLIEHGKKEVEK